MSLNKNEKSTIATVLGGDNEKDRYYVYALCKTEDGKKVPFYIGKGQGERIWQHEEEARNREDAVKKAIDEYLDHNACTEEEKSEIEESFREEISEKINKIEELKKSNSLELVIVKWGLNESEAFMAESALINLLELMPDINLTNIVNGHASEKEKKSNVQTTTAMTVDEFYSSCCKKPIDFDSIKEKWAFININKLYNVGYDESMIRDATRGCWSTACEPEYIFGVYRSRIVGIFKCQKDKKPIRLGEIFTEQEIAQLTPVSEAEFDPDNYPAFKKNDFPLFPYHSRKEDMLRLINHYTSAEKNENWSKRVYFLCEDSKVDTLTLINGTTVSADDLIGRSVLIGGTDTAFSQNPIRTPDLNVYYQNDGNKNKRNVVNQSSLSKALLKRFISVYIHTYDSLRDDKGDLTSGGKRALQRIDVTVRSASETTVDSLTAHEIVFDPKNTTAEELADAIFDYVRSNRPPLIKD